MAVRNSSTTSGANSAQTIAVAAVAGQRVRVMRIDAYTSAGTSTLSIEQGSTVIWQGASAALTTSLTTLDWTKPLERAPGTALNVKTTAAGGGNTVTVNLQADQVGP